MHYDGFKAEALGDDYLGFRIRLEFSHGTIRYDHKGSLKDKRIKSIYGRVCKELTKIDRAFSFALSHISTQSSLPKIKSGVSPRETTHTVDILIECDDHPLLKLKTGPLGPEGLADTRQKIVRAQDQITKLEQNLTRTLQRIHKNIQGLASLKPD